MGLIEMFVANLCLNVTCPLPEYLGENCNETVTCPSYNYGQVSETIRKNTLRILSEEIKGLNIKVTTLQNNLLSGYTKHPNGTIEGTGVAFDLLNILKEKLDFNYTIVVPKGNVFGSRDGGILDEMKKGNVDMAVGFLPMLNIEFYTSVIKYSPNMDTGEWVVLLNRPKESASGSGLLAPFTNWVWVLIILSLLIVGPIIYYIIYLRSKLCPDDDKNYVYSLSNCMWFVYGALLKQGSTLSPMTDSARLCFSTWWLFITILTAFYTANLTAFLTLSKFTLPIENPKEIAQKKFQWITNRGNAIEDSINLEAKERNKGIVKILGQQAYANDNDLSDGEILKKYVQKHGLLYIREKPIIDYVMYDDYKEKVRNNIKEEDRCTYVLTKFHITTYSRGFAYSKYFKYNYLFDYGIQQLVESGIIKFKLKEFLPDSVICPLNLGNTERRLRNTDLLMTYMITGGGLIIAGLIFLIETIYIKLYNKSRKSRPSRLFLDHKKPKRELMDTQNYKNNYYQFDAHLMKKHSTPPPPYNSIFKPIAREHYKIQNVNGTDYWVSNKKDFNMIPYRSPSALLFHFKK